MSPTPPPRAPGAAHRRPAARRATALLAAAAMGLAAPLSEAAAAPARCADPQDQAMFEVAALQAELMVVGITCKQEDRYNAFVERYRPQLAETNRQLTQYINRQRARGRSGPTAADTYITNLAQARGMEGQRLGSDFCPRNTGLFNEVMALPSQADLPAYAAGKDVVPADLSGCAPPAAAAAAAPRTAGRGGPRARGR